MRKRESWNRPTHVSLSAEARVVVVAVAVAVVVVSDAPVTRDWLHERTNVTPICLFQRRLDLGRSD